MTERRGIAVIALKRLAGLRRRLFRMWVRRQMRRYRRSGGMGAGVEDLSGYGLRMEFPDRRIWLAQMNEIFCHDCYGVGRLPEMPFVVDGGANIGTFSLFVKWLRPRATVVAFEASPENATFYERNLRRWLGTDVELVRAAIGTVHGETRIGGLTSDGVRTGREEGFSVPVVRLANWLTRPVDLLKLDVEGDECKALCSAGSGLNAVARVVVEYHLYPGEGPRLSELIGLLEAGGFDRFRIYNACEQPCPPPGLPEYWCLVEATRSKRERFGRD
ncbi:MAG: FkbM family methyltransferase [Kiritimatiellae bacterium]|nr:FkbM family methyltransferase [Kiritimatiellia bacterium]